MRLVSAHRGSALRNRRPTCVRRTDLRYCIPTCVRRSVLRYCIPTRVRRSDLRYCIPTCVRRFVPRYCIPTRVRRSVPRCRIPMCIRRSVLPPTDTHAPPRPVLHFSRSAAAQLAALCILETFPFIGKKMRPVALGSFRIAWKRFHFSITVYYRFLILSTLFSHFFRFFLRRIAFFLRLHAISDCYILVRSSFLHSSHRTLSRRRSQRIVPQKRRARRAVLTNSALAVQDAPQSLQKGSPHAAYRT